MSTWSLAEWSTACIAVFLVASACTRLSIAYAVRRHLYDLPGRRRSHGTAMPRGGGIGIVAGILVALVLAIVASTQASTRWQALAVSAAIVLVAAVGWIDDHGGLHARTRLAAHAIAAIALLAIPAVVVGVAASPGAAALYAVACVVPAIAIVWSVNLHNFMDGIDGLLAMQALFVFGALGLLFLRAGSFIEAGCMATLAAATLGFLPFNFPRPRVFMGDVGSGVLGFVIAAAVTCQLATAGVARTSGIVLCSAFVTDATCTLLSRMLRGRRWYSAHREHLYQWLVRSGFSHARVVAFYMAWNLLIVLPVVYWMNTSPAARLPGGAVAAFAVYALAGLVWYAGRCWCLSRLGMRRHRAAA